MQHRRRLISLTILVLATPAAVLAQGTRPEGSAEARELAITGATLIDGTGTAQRSAPTIIVRDGRIAAVPPDADAEVPAGAREIDAAGKYVIPGLADMHFHLSLGLPQPRQEGETDIVLARALYYGVTTILAIGASDASPESIHSHRARRAAGELRAPYIYGTGGHLTLHGTHPIYTIFPPPVQQRADELAAEMLDREDEFGTIEPGKRADLLILGANPLDDIRNTRSVETVIAEGRVVDRDALPLSIP